MKSNILTNRVRLLPTLARLTLVLLVTMLGILLAPIQAQYTGDLTGSGTASASSEYGSEVAANAFDDNTGTDWGANDPIPQWLKYDFGSSNEKTIQRYPIRTYVNDFRLPDDWTFEGSNNDSTWTTLDTRTNAGLADSTWYTYDFSNSTAYRYYRIYITGSETTDYIEIAEMEMMEASAPEIDVQRPALTSIADGGTDDAGRLYP